MLGFRHKETVQVQVKIWKVNTSAEHQYCDKIFTTMRQPNSQQFKETC